MPESTTQISLIHPLYLDIPMLVSFAAAIEGGVSFGSEVIKESSHDVNSETKMSGKFGISALFNSFFDVSIGADVYSEESQKEKTQQKETRSHTESSLAILLYDQLIKNGKSIKKLKEISDFDNIEPGLLVELAGTLEKNAIDSIIDYIDAINIMSNMNKNPKTKPNKAVQNTNPELRNMRDVLDKDRNRTPISNALLRCSEPPDCTAVVTLRRANLRDLTLTELHKNSVRVLGKVTRIVPAGAKMSAFENYGMSMVKPDTLNEAFEVLKNNDEFQVELSEVEISGPSIQILPLMIYV